jgi:hypothetical protein
MPNNYEKAHVKPSRPAVPEGNEVQSSSSGESLVAHLQAMRAAGQVPRSGMSRDMAAVLRLAEEKQDDASVWDDDFAVEPDFDLRLKSECQDLCSEDYAAPFDHFSPCIASWIWW